MAVEVPGVDGLTFLGRGGFATVYRGWQAAFGRAVAVKVLNVSAVDAATASRFERECRANGSLSHHPNIASVYGSGITTDGHPYMVMDLLPGGSLADRVAQRGPIDSAAAVTIGVLLAGALETAHRAQIVHRDVKPENVLFSAYDAPALADFGISSMEGAFETRSGSITTSVVYAAPEILTGRRATASSDVYALGATLVAALRGVPAFFVPDEENLYPLLGRIASDPVPDLRPYGVPDAVAEVLERSMAKEAAARPSSAAEFGEQLIAAARRAGLPAPTMAVAAVTAPTMPPDHGAGGDAGLVASTTEDGIGDAVRDPSRAVTAPAFAAAPGTPAPIDLAVATPAASESLMPGPARGRTSGMRRSRLGVLALVGLVALVAIGVVAVTRRQVDAGGAGSTGGEAGGPTMTGSLPLIPLPGTVGPNPTPAGAGVGRIAFARAGPGCAAVRCIWVMDADGAGARQVTSPPAGAEDRFPSWSPNGARLAFSRTAGLDKDLFLIDPVTGEETQITSGVAADEKPSFSPDGLTLAFVRTGGGTTGADIYKMRRATGWDFDPPVGVVVQPGNDFDPVWSGDGTTIVFSASFDLQRVNADGTNLQPITDGAPTIQDDGPALSWTDNRLAFARVVNPLPGTYDIMTATSTGTSIQDLTPDTDGSSETFPSWSPDGYFLVYVSDAGGSRQLQRIPATGGPPTQLSEAGNDDRDPDWGAAAPTAPVTTAP